MACIAAEAASKDIYDLNLWHGVVLKAWTDRRSQPRYDPTALPAAITPQNFRWNAISGGPAPECGPGPSRLRVPPEWVEIDA